MGERTLLIETEILVSACDFCGDEARRISAKIEGWDCKGAVLATIGSVPENGVLLAESTPATPWRTVWLAKVRGPISRRAVGVRYGGEAQLRTGHYGGVELTLCALPDKTLARAGQLRRGSAHESAAMGAAKPHRGGARGAASPRRRAAKKPT
jgi:hypothetical protein